MWTAFLFFSFLSFPLSVSFCVCLSLFSFPPHVLSLVLYIQMFSLSPSPFLPPSFPPPSFSLSLSSSLKLFLYGSGRVGGWGSYLTSFLLKQSENGTHVNMQIGLPGPRCRHVYVLYPSPHLPVLASDLQQIAVVSCDHQHSVLEREMGGEVGIGGSVVGLEGRKSDMIAVTFLY